MPVQDRKDTGRTIQALYRLACVLKSDLPDIRGDQIRADIDRYLQCGGDDATRATVQKEDSGKAFLYLVHEAVELQTVKPCLESQPALSQTGRGSVVKRGGTPIARTTQDPWIAAFSRCNNRSQTGDHSPVKVGDTAARVVESQLERYFSGIMFGAAPSLSALASTISTSTNQGRSQTNTVVDAADEDARTRTLSALGLNRCTDATALAEARQYRANVWAIDVQNKVWSRDIATLAYSIWVARGFGHGRDQDDWYAAEETLEIIGGATRVP